MSEGASGSTLHAERVQALLRFASGVLTARDRVQMRMADTRLGVFRQEEVTCLPGVFVGTEDGDWLRLKRQIETAPKAPPDHVATFLPQSLGNPDIKPVLMPAVALEVTIEEASDLVEAGLLGPENINPVVVEGVKREDVVRTTLLAADLREMQRDFAVWLSEDWAPWAEREQPVRKSIVCVR